MKFYLVAFLLLSGNALAVCSSPISRTNNSASTILTSTKYNTDLNTVYTRTNELPGDCVTDNTITAAKLTSNSVTTAKIQDAAVTLAKLAAEVLAIATPPGVILPYGGTTAPSGYLLGNGAAVSRDTYSALFAVIGENFGQGDNVTTFSLPDCRGRFMRFVDGGIARDPDRASRTAMATGGNAGDLVGSIQGDQFESHTHTLDVYSVTGSLGTDNAAARNSSNANTTSSLINATGGNETRPLNFNVQCIIKI